MEDEWRRSQPAMQEEVDAIILVHPNSYLQKILKTICGKLIGSFALLDVKADIISFCNGAGIVDIGICQIMDSFQVFFHEVTIGRLLRGGVLPCVASKTLLLLHIRFCYNFSLLLAVRAGSLLRDVTNVREQYVEAAMQSRRRLELLLNLDVGSAEDEVVEVPLPFVGIEELGPPEPMERITDEDQNNRRMLRRSGGMTRHLLQEDEPLRPVEMEEEIMFGMPPEYLWNTDAIINWLPEDLRPASFFQQEQVRPVVEPQQINGGIPQPPPPQEEPAPEPRPPPRARRVPAAEDALNRISRLNHLDQFIRHVLRRRTRERDLEYKNHLKMLQVELRKSEMVPPTPIVMRPCPFQPEEIQDLVGELTSVNLPERPLHDQRLGVSMLIDKTMTSDLSGRTANFPLTPADVQGAAELMDNITPIALQNLLPQPAIGMEPTFDIAHDVLPQMILPENVADESLGVEPLTVGQTPQPVPPTIEPEREHAIALDEPMQGVEVPQVGQTPQPVPPTIEPERVHAIALDEPMQGVEVPQVNVEGRMQNLFQEPTNAALTVSVLVGNTSFEHTLPTHEVIEPEVVQPEENIAGRLRPVRPRRLEFDSPPTSPPRRKRRRTRVARTPRAVAVDADANVANANAADANVGPRQVPDANFDDLGVMHLPAFEPPTEEQQMPVEGYAQMFLDTSDEIRKLKFIKKLKELQIVLGDLFNFLQICPAESTLRSEATIVFRMLIELCHAKQIELIQEVPYAPDKLFVKISKHGLN